MNVAVVGDERFTLGFKMAGVTAAYEFPREEFPDRINTIMEQEEGVLIVAGNHMNALSEPKRLEIQNSVDPVVIPITEGEGEDTDLRSKIKQAIGIDIWSE